MTWLVGLVIASGAPKVIRADVGAPRVIAPSGPTGKPDRSVIADVAATAPFDASELAEALRLRLPVSGAQVRVRVVTIAGGVRIEARGNSREVALRGSSGLTAARLVALAASDLLLDDLAVAPEVSAAPSSAAPRATTIAALGGIAGWGHPLAGLAVDLAAARGAWLVGIEAGGERVLDSPLRLTAGTIRLGAGARLGQLELRAGLTVMPLTVGDGSGDSTVLVGGGASARLRAPITDRMRAVLVCGDDVFATRTTYMIDRVSVLTTPRNSLWFAAGIEVTP
jgi:hypothetical protein